MKKVCVFFAEGTEECEALLPWIYCAAPGLR